MSAPKIITILGTVGVGKSTCFRQLVRLYAAKKNSVLTSSAVNYVESHLKIKGNSYKLIDTPSFLLKPTTEITRAIKQQNEMLIKKSALII
jgi:predicted GTPase